MKTLKESEVRSAHLIEKRDALVKVIAEVDIDILVLERTDPSLQVARKDNLDGTGKAVSSVPITAADMLKSKREDRAGHQLRLDAVNILLKQV